MLPPGAGRNEASVRLASRSACPCDAVPWVEDRRRLGVRVSRLTLTRGRDVVPIPLDHPLLSRGWWDIERDDASHWRWTDGDAVIPVLGSGPAMLEISLAGGVNYPLEVVRAACAGEPARVYSAAA